MRNLFKEKFFSNDESLAEDSVYDSRELLKKTTTNPLFVAAAVVGTTLAAYQAYRYVRPKNRRPTWKSRSRHPQISRWESEGGDVPQVQALVVRRVEH